MGIRSPKLIMTTNGTHKIQSNFLRLRSMSNRFYVIFILFLSHFSWAQLGGTSTFQFLDLDFNARSAALGGDFFSVKDDDINLAVANPASVTSNMSNHLSLNHGFYPSGINYGQLAYGLQTQKAGIFVPHLRYVAYGQFTRTDEYGQEQGTFTAGDYSLGTAYGYQLNPYFSLGANLNLIFSHYEMYSSFGVGVDVAVMFHDDKSNVSAVLLTRNIGYQIKGYTSNNHEPLPLEVLAGVSYQMEHAPFRISMMGHDLTTWDLSYDDQPDETYTVDVLTGDTVLIDKASFAEKLFRHLNFGIEILPSDNFSIRLGYNYNRRQSLGIQNRMLISGFSAGVGFKIKKFEFDYALSSYSSVGTLNMFSITTNLNEWYKKRE